MWWFRMLGSLVADDEWVGVLKLIVGEVTNNVEMRQAIPVGVEINSVLNRSRCIFVSR